MASTMLDELCKQMQHCCARLQSSRKKRNVGGCWLKSLSRVCKRMQHVTPSNVGSCCMAMMRPFAWTLMADKDIEDDLKKLYLCLIIPPFLKDRIALMRIILSLEGNQLHSMGFMLREHLVK